MSELEEAWAEVHDALPPGWDVMRPSYHVEDRRWHVFAADHRRGRKRPDYVEAVGATEAQALRDLAVVFRVWQVEPVEESLGPVRAPRHPPGSSLGPG